MLKDSVQLSAETYHISCNLPIIVANAEKIPIQMFFYLKYY